MVVGRNVVGLDFQGLAGLGDGVVELPSLGQGEAEIVMGGGEVGLDLQGLAELEDGFVDLSLAGQGDSEVVMGHGVAGLEFEHLEVQGDGLVDLALAGQHKAEVVEGLDVAGVDFQHLAVLIDGRIDLPLGGQDNSQIAMGDDVPRRAGQGVGPQLLAVLPIGGLVPGIGQERREQERATGGGEPAERRPMARKPVQAPAQAPDHGDGEADVRQVGVAIGPGMRSDLHEADGGHEGAEKPEPADDERGLPAARQERGQGNAGQEEQRAADLPRRVAFRLRIKGRQPAGPEELAKIDAIGNRGIGDPRGKGDVLQGRDVAGLAEDGRHATRGARERTAAPFPAGGQPGRLAGRAFPRSPLPAPRSPPLPPAQRPVVQEQEQKGECHQRGLCQEAQGEQPRHRQIAGERQRAADISDIGGDGRDEKQPAQGALPFAHPGHRFGPQRMDGKDQRHQALDHRLPVIRRRARKRTTAVAACRRTLVR